MIRVVSGRMAEFKVYLAYLRSLLIPGSSVPVFQAVPQRIDSLARYEDDDLKILIEESRRQLDRQSADLQRNHTRAATLLTVAGAEAAYLLTVDTSHVTIRILDLSALVLAILAIGGAVAVLTSSAVYGRVSVQQLTEEKAPLQAKLALQYVNAVPVGDVTNAARLTVLRDAVWLASLTAVAILCIAALNHLPSSATAPCQSPSTASPTTCVNSPNPAHPSPSRSDGSPSGNSRSTTP